MDPRLRRDDEKITTATFHNSIFSVTLPKMKKAFQKKHPASRKH